MTNLWFKFQNYFFINHWQKNILSIFIPSHLTMPFKVSTASCSFNYYLMEQKVWPITLLDFVIILNWGKNCEKSLFLAAKRFLNVFHISQNFYSKKNLASHLHFLRFYGFSQNHSSFLYTRRFFCKSSFHIVTVAYVFLAKTIIIFSQNKIWVYPHQNKVWESYVQHFICQHWNYSTPEFFLFHRNKLKFFHRFVDPIICLISFLLGIFEVIRKTVNKLMTDDLTIFS